jgi:hypothetical protein
MWWIKDEIWENKNKRDLIKEERRRIKIIKKCYLWESCWKRKWS